MKKFALALAAAGLSTGVMAGPLDYDYLEASVQVDDKEALDSQQILGVVGNKRFGALFVGGQASYFLSEGNNGEQLDHYTADAEVGLALGLGESQEIAAAVGYFYADFTDIDQEIDLIEARLQYTYSCDEGRHYEAEYFYVQDADDSDDNTDAVRLSVEGGDRNTWRYDIGLSRNLDTDVNAIDGKVIFPLTPQDQGELVIGLDFTGDDDNTLADYGYSVGYRWNLD